MSTREIVYCLERLPWGASAAEMTPATGLVADMPGARRSYELFVHIAIAIAVGFIISRVFQPACHASCAVTGRAQSS